MFASNDEQLGLAEDFFQKVAAKEPAPELAWGIMDQGDRSSELVLRAPDGGGDLGQAHAPDDVEVYVAPRALAPFGDRPEDECTPDAPFERLQCRAEDFDCPGGLDHEPPQLWKHRRRVVGPKVDPVAFDATAENPGARQPRQVALETRGTQAHVLGKVGEVPPPLRVHQGCRKDRLARPGKKR